LTYKNLKSLTSALLTGDFVIPEDDDEMKMLTNYAYLKIATEADALKLFTFTNDEQILREGKGNTYIRMPRPPENDDDDLDIDDELGYVAARFIASFISKAEGLPHEREAYKLINDYNSKVDSYLSSLAEDMYNEEHFVNNSQQSGGIYD
jgi:hypothetical protein